jgi:hypothetical protein
MSIADNAKALILYERSKALNVAIKVLFENYRLKKIMGKWGFSFSLSRLLGISGLKNSIARKTGIPTTRGGMNNKIGKDDY